MGLLSSSSLSSAIETNGSDIVNMHSAVNIDFFIDFAYTCNVKYKLQLIYLIT